MAKSLIDKLKNTGRSIRNLALVSAAVAGIGAGSIGLASCQMPGQNNPINSKPTASLSVSPNSGTGTLYPTISLNGSSANGNITNYQLQIDDNENGTIDRVVNSSTPINRSDIGFSSNAYVYGQVTDSSGTASPKVKETVTVTNPLYYTISGVLKDNETQSLQNGLVRIFSGSTSSMSPVSISQGGDGVQNNEARVTNGSFSFQIPKNLGLASIILQAEETDSSFATQQSYVRTVDGLPYSDISSSKDTRLNPISVVPFTNLTATDTISTMSPKSFANLVYYANTPSAYWPGPTNGNIIKWNFDNPTLPYQFKGIEIMTQNPSNAGIVFNTPTQTNLADMVNNPSNPNYVGSLIRGRSFPVISDTAWTSNSGQVIQKDSSYPPKNPHYTLSYLDGNNTYVVTPQDGWIIVEPIASANFDETFTQFDGNSGTYQYAAIGLNSTVSPGNVIGNLAAHELERALLNPQRAPDTTINGGYQVYELRPNSWYDKYGTNITLIDDPVTVNQPTTPENKEANVIYGPSYSFGENISKVLGWNFGTNTLPY